ncbi:MAG: preprotein translocase subunit SecE [Candidatus Sungbacteria bacterium RIFCSPHIGHO2_02_FULL_49_12]|uniref:Protein translocase subunit SecE n=1 Tax=Candidatus Sungbacteria bacterium RIFCSPHIGHO2_02_FULL_49_12 TaxID=1802271 RepID=A0A1G2KNG3_9BACT|nr:MAG: preprotein translocase subunit SecE [Candidatus Sungbacteria bacterium RIFCSPHIGHO2_02_FULL_49_12]
MPNPGPKLVTYIKEARQELMKVTWPTREEAIRSTIVVVAVSLAVALFLGGVDFVLAYILNRFIL